MTYDRQDWEERGIQALKTEIAQRLRAVCEREPDEAFDRLVEGMARIQRKYEQQRIDELLSMNSRPLET